MNLKGILGKITASIIAVYLVLGNFVVAGLGLKEVIAEEIVTPRLAVEQSIEKYIQYSKENYKGAVIQTNIGITETTGREEHLPVSTMKLNINVPSISGVLPERISVIKANTVLTNGTENYSVNQNYNKDTGLLVVSYENSNNYSEYKENTKDEFEIIYIYPESAYADNYEQKAITQEINIEAEYKVHNKSLYSHARKIISETISSDVNIDVANYDIKNVTEIYKGYMYANEKFGNTYKTDYKLVEELSILNKDLIDNLTIKLDQSSYKDIDSKEIKANSVAYKSSKISSANFYKLFGIDGYMDFYVGDTKYASIKYSEEDENGNRNYETVYYTVQKDNIEAGKIEYSLNTKVVTIKTSKPTGEGIITLENEKQILSQSKYEKSVTDLNEIKESRNLNANKIENLNEEQKVIEITNRNIIGSISLKEPTHQISLNLSNNKLSTLTTNNITATIKINDTNSSCKLINGGNIELTLPANIANANIISAKSLYENGISIKRAKIENGKVILEIAGQQTSYDTLNISGGVNIVLDLEVDIADDVSTHNETITAKYNDGVSSKQIEIVSKPGVLMETIIKNETKNTEAIKIINANKIIETSINDVKQIQNIELNIVNNYDIEISNVQFIGNLSYSDEITKSTYNLMLEKAITATNGNVLYSNDANTWNENYTAQSKYFKIVVDNNKLSKGDSVKAVLKLSIPANLNYNEASYLKYAFTYTLAEKEESTSSVIGFVTEKSDTQNVIDETKPVLEVSTKTIAGNEQINSGDEVNEGQSLKTIVTLKNNSARVNTYTVNTTINNAVYYEKYVTGQEYNITGSDETRYHETEPGDVERSTTITIPAGSTIQYSYQYVVSKGVTNVNNNIKILENNNNVFEKNINNNVKEAKMKITLEYAYNEEKEVFKTLDVIYKVKNYTDKDMKNIELQSINSDELTAINSECYENASNMSISYDDSDKNKLSIKINELKADETIEFVITYSVSLDLNITQANVFVYATCNYKGNTYISNIFEKNAYQSKTDLMMNVTNNLNSENIKVGDNIIFTTHITNNGSVNLESTNIYFNASNGIELTGVYIVKKDGTRENIDISTGESNYKIINININKNDDITIVYNAKVRYIDDENVKISFSLYDKYNNKIEKTVNLRGIVEKESDTLNSPDDPENPNNPSNQDNSSNTPNSPIKNTYSISGLAWLDGNKDGKRDENEQLLSGIKVYLVNTKTGKFVTNIDGKEITVLTGENGEYKFEGISNDSYLVIFEFDTNKYKVTRYQLQNTDTKLNSDAIMNKIRIDENEKVVGITNAIDVKSDLNNIDIGLIENAKFDLSIEKQISKIEVINAQGTKTTEYDNINFAKVDLVAKYMNNTSVIVTYKFIIRNNGDVAGYVESLKDIMPKGLEFSSEFNKDWYKGEDGALYTTALNKNAIEPGESSEIELILTKETTEESTGTFTNNAELEKISNIEAVEEAKEDNNKSSADLVISIKTGSIFLYIGITLGSIAIVAVGAYIIKKKILDRGI